MAVPPVRTITLGLAEPHPLSRNSIEQVGSVLRQAQEQYRAIGYEVQTLRLSTRSLLADLADWSDRAILVYAGELQKILEDVALEYCSIGTVDAARADFPLVRLDLVADILIANTLLSGTVQLATLADGLRLQAAQSIAQIIKRLAAETSEGFGNFRFAMLACVEAAGPFFPAAYHRGPTSLTLGLQGASIISAALQAHGADALHALDLLSVVEWVRSTMLAHAEPIVQMGQQIAHQQGIAFGGIDLSPAPMGEDSIATAIELCGYGPVGAPGTLGVVASITAGLKSTGLPTCGYCGLMLPVLEDAVLGRRWAEENLTVHQLLLYSAVCGTGLDTIPLAGDLSNESIAHLLVDVATLALRLQKPLSARLFPVQGRQAGAYTAFTSPYLINTKIKN